MTTTSNRHIITFAFIAGIAYRLLMGLQGMDSIDMGFCMTFYQNIFTHPESMTFYFNYYLTGFFGGLWHLLFGQFGLLGFRLFETLTMSGTLWLLYRAFRPWLTSVWVAAAAILLSFLFPSFILTFHYDTLSFLLMSASVYALSKWVKGNRLRWLLLAGVFIGICFFARIVNLTMAALVLVPLSTTWLQSRSLRGGIVYAFGVLLGIILVVALLLVTGQWGYFETGVGEAFGVFNGSETSHTSSNLVTVYLKSYVNIALQMVALMLIALAYAGVWHFSSVVRRVLSALLLVVLLILVCTSQPYMSAFAACALLLLWVMISETKLFNRATDDVFMRFGLKRFPFWAETPPVLGRNASRFGPNHQPVSGQNISPFWAKTLLAYVLLMACLFPFGSDIGIPGIFHWCGGLLIIPAASCCAHLSLRWQHQLLGALALCVALSMLVKTYSNNNGDESPRLQATTAPLSTTLNALTSPERTLLYRNITDRIVSYSKGNPLLLIANQASELYYATGMIPFTGNTQMGTFMGTSLLERLDRQQQFYQQLPVVVFLLRGFDTPDMPLFRQDLQPWMDEKQYRLAYTDSDLQIYTTNRY